MALKQALATLAAALVAVPPVAVAAPATTEFVTVTTNAADAVVPTMVPVDESNIDALPDASPILCTSPLKRPVCCEGGLFWLANTGCVAPSPQPDSPEGFVSQCTEQGRTAMCCAYHVLGNYVLCTEPDSGKIGHGPPEKTVTETTTVTQTEKHGDHENEHTHKFSLQARQPPPTYTVRPGHPEPPRRGRPGRPFRPHPTPTTDLPVAWPTPPALKEPSHPGPRIPYPSSSSSSGDDMDLKPKPSQHPQPEPEPRPQPPPPPPPPPPAPPVQCHVTVILDKNGIPKQQPTEAPKPGPTEGPKEPPAPEKPVDPNNPCDCDADDAECWEGPPCVDDAAAVKRRGDDHGDGHGKDGHGQPAPQPGPQCVVTVVVEREGGDQEQPKVPGDGAKKPEDPGAGEGKKDYRKHCAPGDFVCNPKDCDYDDIECWEPDEPENGGGEAKKDYRKHCAPGDFVCNPKDCDYDDIECWEPDEPEGKAAQ